jgi:hypothetical protein
MAENLTRTAAADKPGKAPEPEKFPAEQLLPYARVWFDSTPDALLGALATAPDNRSQFTVDEVKELLTAREKTVLDPYAGVPETYPVPAGHLDSLTKKAEREAAGPVVQSLLTSRQGEAEAA